jgi:hypothetical protein
MVFSTSQIQQSDIVNWPQVEDSLVSIDELHDGYRRSDNEHRHYLEDYMRDKTISDGLGDMGLKSSFAFTPEETREMQENYRFSHDLSGVDELLDAGSYMDDTSSMFGFESDYLLSEVDDGSMATYEKMVKYRRELDLQMMMMKKMFEKQVVRDREIERYLKQNEHFNRRAGGNYGMPNRRNPMYRNGGNQLLLMPIGEGNSTDNNSDMLNSNMPTTASAPSEWGGQERRNAQSGQVQRAPTLEDEALRRQWCSNRKPVPLQKLKSPVKSQQASEYNGGDQQQLERRPPPPPQDDLYEPLPENLLVKVRNIHPTPSLHELHVQHPEIFRQKPTFTSVQYGFTLQRRKRFAVLCQFEFNGATLYAQETAPTKSDAKLNAARAMIRKLKHTANVSITLKEESMRAAADTSLEHPRCRLLHLHDTQPDIYPQPPTFRASRCRTRQNIGKSRYTNMICYFQVGTDKLTTVGAAHNKKQAIVQAARNMLRLLALPEHSDKNNQLKVEYTPPDRTQTPWTCHFCKIFMTGRRPFMSHLMGRCHVQRLSELGLNAEDENKILQEMAEKAFKEKEELKKKNAAKNNAQKRNQKPRFPKSARAGKKNTTAVTATTTSRFPAATPSSNRFSAVPPTPSRFPKPTSSSLTSSDTNPEQGSEKSGMLISVPCSSNSSLA